MQQNKTKFDKQSSVQQDQTAANQIANGVTVSDQLHQIPCHLVFGAAVKQQNNAKVDKRSSVQQDQTAANQIGDSATVSDQTMSCTKSHVISFLVQL